MTAGFRIRRLRWIMKPEPGDPIEVEGVLNPAAVRGPDGQLYLFPRLVAKGNYSRIGMARVRFDDAGDPGGVEWLGTALEPEEDYERGAAGRGGCEDPRITFVYRPVTGWASDRPRDFGGSVPLAPSGVGEVRTVRRDRVRGSGQQGCECLPDRDT